jgi:hypothetical protein
MKFFLVIVTGIIGTVLVVRSLIKNIKEIKAKPPSTHTFADKLFNYPLMVLWFIFLLAFFIGLIVNNLIWP